MGDSKPIIALLIPTYNNDFILDQCLDYISWLNPQPSWYIFAENNSTDATMSVLFDWKMKHPNTKIIRLWFKPDAIKQLGNPYAIIGIMRQFLLMKARTLNVDFAIFVDDDILLADKNFLPRITKHKKDLVGGAYFRSYPKGNLLSYLAFNTYKNKNSHPYRLRNFQMFKLSKVAAISGGCMCISKKLLMDTRANFYPIPDHYNTGHAGEDFAYCVTARDLGYEVWVDDTFRICHFQDHEARPWRKAVGSDDYIEFEYGRPKQK